jgi:hypothetical protein
MRLFFLLLAAALVAAPAALADGYAAPAAQLGTGVVSSDGAVRYVAAPAFDNTSLLAISTKDGMVVNETQIVGSWGIPILSFGPTGFDGLSHDGTTLVLGDTATRPDSHFLVYDTRTFRMKDGFFLHGTFSFDALSPDASTVYLIQHPSARDLNHYVVRAYDLERHRLLPGRIADRTQKSWVMQGTAVTRTTSADGRWVYTLYANPGGYPFVHALDTVGGRAHCIGLAWKSEDQSALANVVLSVRGKALDVHWRSGAPWYRVDTTSWRAERVTGRSAWWWIAPALAAILVLAMELLRRGRRRLPVSVQGGRDGATAEPDRRSVPRRGSTRRSGGVSSSVRSTGR